MAQVATFSNGKITGTYTYNTNDNEEFIISSASKTILGITAAKMQEDGIINLDTSIDKYWHQAHDYDYNTCTSEWRAYLSNADTLKSYTAPNKDLVENKASLRNFLTHSSTIKNLSMIWMIPGDETSEYFGGGLSQSYGRAAFMLAHTSHQLFEEKGVPGTKTSYNSSNDGLTREHAVAAFTMQMAMKKSINEYLGEKILSPLGATSSGFAIGNSIYFATSYKTSAINLAKIIAAVANDGVYEGKTIFSKSTIDTIEKVESNLNNQTIAFDYINGKYVKYGYYKSIANASYYGLNYKNVTYIAYNPNTSEGIVVNVRFKQNADQNVVKNMFYELDNY
jgi:CubicO group peptidase (beta-lactamase class C family)